MAPPRRVDFKPRWMENLSAEDDLILGGFTHNGSVPEECEMTLSVEELGPRNTPSWVFASCSPVWVTQECIPNVVPMHIVCAPMPTHVCPSLPCHGPGVLVIQPVHP